MRKWTKDSWGFNCFSGPVRMWVYTGKTIRWEAEITVKGYAMLTDGFSSSERGAKRQAVKAVNGMIATIRPEVWRKNA